MCDCDAMREALVQAHCLLNGMVLNGRIDQHEVRNTFQKIGKALSQSPTSKRRELERAVIAAVDFALEECCEPQRGGEAIMTYVAWERLLKASDALAALEREGK